MDKTFYQHKLEVKMEMGGYMVFKGYFSEYTWGGK